MEDSKGSNVQDSVSVEQIAIFSGFEWRVSRWKKEDVQQEDEMSSLYKTNWQEFTKSNQMEWGNFEKMVLNLTSAISIWRDSKSEKNSQWKTLDEESSMENPQWRTLDEEPPMEMTVGEVLSKNL